MKVDNKQKINLHKLILERIEEVTELTTKAVEANALHVRSATVSLIIKVGRNADDPSLIEVEVQEKIKSPKSRTSDLTSWSETELLMSFATREEPGQQHLGD